MAPAVPKSSFSSSSGPYHHISACPCHPCHLAETDIMKQVLRVESNREKDEKWVDPISSSSNRALNKGEQ